MFKVSLSENEEIPDLTVYQSTQQDSLEIQNLMNRVQVFLCRAHDSMHAYLAIRRRAVHMTVHHLLTLFYLFAPGDSKVSLMMAL